MVLCHALERASRVAVARYAWHGRERLGLLRVRGDVIALHGLLWPDEIRDPAAVVRPPVQLDEDEIDEAMALIEAMTRDDLTGPEFADRYTEALHAVVEAKQEDRKPPQAPEPTARPGAAGGPDGRAAGVRRTCRWLPVCFVRGASTTSRCSCRGSLWHSSAATAGCG
ncbi:Ku protein [Streptomyces avermitilis]